MEDSGAHTLDMEARYNLGATWGAFQSKNNTAYPKPIPLNLRKAPRRRVERGILAYPLTSGSGMPLGYAEYSLDLSSTATARHKKLRV